MGRDLPETYTVNAPGEELDPYDLQRDALASFRDFAGQHVDDVPALAPDDTRVPGIDYGALDGLFQDLYGRALEEGEDYRDRVEAFERILFNYEPGVYGDLQGNGHAYEVSFGDDPRAIDGAMESLMSCWEFVDDALWTGRVDEDLEGATPTRMSWALDWAEDPHTHFARTTRDGDLVGYSRAFELDESRGRSVLGIDTIEVEKKEFEENVDAIRVQSLAMIRRGLDLGMDWIVATGQEGRISRGPRQAYGDTERSIHYAKRGERVQQAHALDVTTRGDGPGRSTTYLLFENPATV